MVVMEALHLIAVWLHVLAVAVWLGGSVFLALVLVPATRQPEYRGMAASLIAWTGTRFSRISWACFGVLLLTGLFNIFYHALEEGAGWTGPFEGQFWQGEFGRTLALKLALVAVIFAGSALHDFAIGPHATALWQADPRSEQAARLRRQASYIGRLNLLLALVVVALGVVLSRH